MNNFVQPTIRSKIEQPVIPKTKPDVDSDLQSKGTERSSGRFGEVDLASLHLPLDATSINLSQVPENHPMQKNPILIAVKKAGVQDIALDDWQQLPRLAESFVNLYGPHSSNESGPVIFGMETCAAYRNAVPLKERYTGPAGMFNTGTNALGHHLHQNILNVPAVGQIPWGRCEQI
jgi:hypothetical protein